MLSNLTHTRCQFADFFLNQTTGSRETSEEKAMSPGHKGSVLQKGRFSVTSVDVNLEVIHPLVLTTPFPLIWSTAQ